MCQDLIFLDRAGIFSRLTVNRKLPWLWWPPGVDPLAVILNRFWGGGERGLRYKEDEEKMKTRKCLEGYRERERGIVDKKKLKRGGEG